MTTPVLTNFVVAPRVYGTVPFNLTNPTSDPSGGVFTFTSSNTEVATISGRTITILKSGNTTITATRAEVVGYTSASISALFTVNIATPTLSNFTIPNTSFSDASFALTNPTSNSPGVFSYRSLTTSIVAVSGTIVTLKRVGRAVIEASQFPATNYNGNASIVAEFDVLSSIVRVGIQNEIDLSWNTPVNNGATVKNYFFSVDERLSTTVPAPPVSTIMSTIAPRVTSYYSYALPVPYSTQIISPNNQLPTGIDINSPDPTYTITTLPAFTQKNQIDLGYYGEIEISWVYHNDNPIVELIPNTNESTTMTLSLFKEASVVTGDNRIDLLRSIQRNYDSEVNCLGPRPQNNNKTMTDVFTVGFDTGFDTGSGSVATVDRALKYLKSTDIVSGSVTFSSLSYSPASNPAVDVSYSIIFQSIRIIPYRLPITREFTSLGFGAGSAVPGVGFTVSTVNAMALSDVSGILYHMPKMTRSLTDFNEAKLTFSWNYGANITKLTTDISFLPISIRSGSTVQNIQDLDIPFQLRIRGYSRPYSKATNDPSVTIEKYNTTIVSQFLTNLSNSLYHTRLLFDTSLNLSASYAEIVGATSESTTIDISAASGFPAFSDTLDTSDTQFVFLFQLSIADSSYNAYFRSIAGGSGEAAAANAFRVKMLSQTFTPRQEYRFGGPDPTLLSSNAQSSASNTVYSLSNPYTNITPYYRFYNLTNGVFYSYKIASNNRAGTSAFSDALTRRCGSIPNQIVNRIVANRNTFEIESERTSNQVNIYWVKPQFSGYDITRFVIEMAIDPSGRWLNFIEYTKDLSHNLITFGVFDDILVPITNEARQTYSSTINSYIYKTTRVGGPLINGSKYYLRLASVNELGYSLYSTILSGVVFARPITAPIEFKETLSGNQLVYITWKIPQDDAGSPILTYVIDYKEESASNTLIPYRENANVPVLRQTLKDIFFEVYTKYKNYDSLNLVDRANLDISRNQLLSYIIPPTPITLNDPDNLLNPVTTPNKNVILTFTQKTFTYISDELRQNVFDIENIQLKWYYFQDIVGTIWPDDSTTVSFKMSIRGHLKDVSGNSSLDISNIFYIPPGNVYGGGAGAYNVNRTLFSTTSDVNYIRYDTGQSVSDNNTPKIRIPTLPRIDSYNNRRYKLQIDYEITEFSPNTGQYRFILYSGPVVINGTAPIRTSPDMSLNTIFTYKIQHVEGISPILNNKTYQFTITPFNLNEFFPDVNRITCSIGTDFSVPVTDVSYSLVPTTSGGKVELRWKYSQISDYNITIRIAQDHDDGVEEYPSNIVLTGERSIFVKNLISDSAGYVSYSIPSTQPNDVLDGYAQPYLKSGRAYSIRIGPVKIVIDSVGNLLPLESPKTDITPYGAFVVPFRIPLRPLDLSVLGNNGSVTLRWKLPNLTSDPNYYVNSRGIEDPNPVMPYYRYKYYSLDMRNISLDPPGDWTSVISELAIPSENVAESETTRVVSGVTNENNHQFRVRLMIINEFNSQRAFSDYTYFTRINEVVVVENSENTVYPSIYPYKPGIPLINNVSRAENSETPGLFNILELSFRFPAYNGNADFYECYAEYTPPSGASGSGTSWTDIFDATSIGLANRSANTAIIGSTGGVRTAALTGSNGTQTFSITCKAAITLQYGIRIRIIGRKSSITVYPNTLFSDYSVVDFIDF